VKKLTAMGQCLLLLDIAHHLRLFLTDQTRELTGLTLEQAVVLCCINKHHSVVTISDIATAVSRTNHTITGMINILVKRGLVSRRQDSAGDRRRVLLSLTDEGKARLETYQKVASTVIEPLLLASGSTDAEERLSQAIATLAALLPGW